MNFGERLRLMSGLNTVLERFGWKTRRTEIARLDEERYARHGDCEPAMTNLKTKIKETEAML